MAKLMEREPDDRIFALRMDFDMLSAMFRNPTVFKKELTRSIIQYNEGNLVVTMAHKLR